VSAACIESGTSIVDGDPLGDVRLWLERQSNATEGSFRTFAEIAARLETICLEGKEAYPPPTRETFKELDRSLDYLEGLSWTLFDRRQRHTVTNLRRAVRALERRTRHDPTSPPVTECVVCRARLDEVDNLVGYSRSIQSNGGLITGLSEDDARVLALRVPSHQIVAGSRETAAATIVCERAFAWYRAGAALRHGRIRNAGRFLAEWITLVIRRG